MAAVATEWESLPPFSEVVQGIIEATTKTYRETFIEEREHLPVEITLHYSNVTKQDVLLVVTASIALTVLRYFCTEWIFKPLSQRYDLTLTNQRKMPESAWRFLYYLCSFSYCFYVVVLSGNHKFLQKRSVVLNGWSLSESPSTDMYYMYVLQCSFYLHYLYATLLLDTWRKDSFLVIVHHLLTILLISISYSVRLHRVGLLVYLFIDVNEIFVESSKLNVYFKTQGNVLKRKHEIMANISFVCLIISWFVTRLYLYSLIVLFMSAEIFRLKLAIPSIFIINVLTWILLIMNTYWFWLMLQLLYRVVTGQVREVDDSREYDVDEKFNKQISSKKKHK